MKVVTVSISCRGSNTAPWDHDSTETFSQKHKVLSARKDLRLVMGKCMCYLVLVTVRVHSVTVQFVYTQ